MSIKWHFRQFSAGDVVNDPIERALFSQESVTSHPSSALVREAIQNSLDAKRPDSRRVVVRFTLHREAIAPTSQQSSPLVEGLFRHLTADECGLQDPPAVNAKVPLLLVEDFGTTGLIGDPTAWEPARIGQNAFFLFLRALGRSGKSGEQRGRWGVGKFVFPLASRANAWFAYTRQAETAAHLLFGRCVLKTHSVDRNSWHPDGTWGIGRVEDRLILPVDGDNARFDQLLNALRLQRREEAGLSVVIPWVRQEVTTDSIRDAVLREYFLPIIRGDLEVSVRQGDAEEELLTESTLDEAVRRLGDDGLNELVALAREGEKLPVFELRSAFRDGYPEWREELLPLETREQCAFALESGRAVRVRIPFKIRPKNLVEQTTHIDLLLKSSPQNAPASPLVIREGITIPDAKTRRIHGYIAIVLVDDAPMASLVGDSESPSHTQLLHELLRDKYVFGKRYLAFLREAPAGFLRAIAGSAMEEDSTLLAAFFPELAEGPAVVARPTRKRGQVSPIPTPPARRPARYHLRQSTGGFTLAGVADSSSTMEELELAVAYEVRRGNPLRKYRSFDFRFEDNELTIDVANASILEREGNRLRVVPQSPDFRVSVTGFDAHRNLFVRVYAK